MFACCKKIDTIDASDSFKDYNLEMFSQACQLMFTWCAATQINCPKTKQRSLSKGDSMIIF